MFIPGMKDFLEIPSIRRNEMRENSRNHNDSLRSADKMNDNEIRAYAHRRSLWSNDYD